MTELGSIERNLLAALAEADEPTQSDRERVRALVLQRVATATGIAAATWVAGSSGAAGSAATGTTAAGGSAAAAGSVATSSSVTAAATGAVAGGVALSGGTAVTGAAAGGGAAVAGGTVAGGAAAGGAAVAGLKGLVAAKVAASVLGVSLAGGAGWYAVNASAPAPQQPESVPAAVVPAAAVPPARVAAPVELAVEEQETVQAEDTIEEAASAKDHKAARPAERTADRLGEEAELLKSAQQAVNSGDTTTALALIQKHATKYPNGVLSQERLGMRAITLCRAGDSAQGSAAAKRFLANNPSSPISDRVGSACGE